MSETGTKRTKLSARINAYVASDKPLRKLAGDLSKRAKEAMNEATTLSLERIDIRLGRLPKKLDGLKCVHLSDIHHSPLTELKHIERAVKFANRLKPDIVLLTGDYVSHDSDYIAPVAETLAKLRSPMGTFACLGNHDHWTDAAMVTELFRGEGITMLVNEGLRLGDDDGASFWLGGVDDHMVGQTDIAAALTGSYPDEVKILLAHNPVIFRQAVKKHVDLTLSGHTHGGQVKLRDKEKNMIRRRKLSSGLHERNSSQIYITRGIGTVVLPVRYQCPPEITLLTLRSV
ncbi:MAG: metallophosphoesterase [Acidobacteria bacterium]|nr:metallophosphoesterase [Acidobacteriota bacterium]